MPRALRVTILLLTTAALVFPGSGCAKKDEAQTNPEFKAPNIPPGRTAADGGPPAPGGAKQPKK